MNKIIPNIAETAIKTIESQDKIFDYLMVQNTSQAMLKKLAKKREEGYGGWHHPNKEICSNEKLIDMLKKHIEKGDMIDVMNFAAMIHSRNEMYGDSTVSILPKDNP